MRDKRQDRPDVPMLNPPGKLPRYLAPSEAKHTDSAQNLFLRIWADSCAVIENAGYCPYANSSSPGNVVDRWIGHPKPRSISGYQSYVEALPPLKHCLLYTSDAADE